MTDARREPDRAARADPPQRAPVPSATLRALLAFDDGDALRLLCAPADHDPAVRRVAVGTDDLRPGQDGTLLLAVGAPSTAATLRRAARLGACAVVLGDATDARGAVRPQLAAAAEQSGLALLVRAEGADWAGTAALLRSAVAYPHAAVDPAAGRAGGDPVSGAGAIPSLAALAARTAALVRGSITVEDTELRVLAHSATGPDADPLRRSTILGGRVPPHRVAELRRSGILRALWTSEEVVHRPADGANPERLAVAVRVGAEVLGSIWAAADGRPPAPDAARHLRAAAVLAAPLLVAQRLRESGTARRREHALRGLLHGVGDRRTHAWSLGLSADTPCAVLVARRARPEHDGDRTLDVLSLQAAAHPSVTGVLREGDGAALLVTPDARGPGPAAAVLALARDLDAFTASLPDAVPVWLGAGPVVASPAEADASYARAALVVRVLRDRERRAGAAGRSRPPRFADTAGVGPALDVLRVLDAARPLWDAGAGPVHEMVRADLAAGGGLVRTLAAYLDTGGDVQRAADRLVLHPNTVRYRLGRVRERHGVDLDDPDTRLLLTLAVRLTAVRDDT
ncbi:helix-turn-helix domain-containing protein [Streptomyces sp. NPDC008150]|uniref:PucR family transcriptional regulator n=1 Tax=Streptomyces sp. NPDC008150 TaxID=3364816 RepID=UPI0036F13216